MDYNQILDAHKRLGGIATNTQLVYSSTFSNMSSGNIYLKTENTQRTGSFKIRGAFNKIAKMADSGVPIKGVIAASAGNHAQGVALAAHAKNIPCTIVMPKNAPIAKIDATKGYGAKVVLEGDFYDDAYNHARKLAKEKGFEFIHAFNDIDIVSGQGTIAIEILEQLPKTDIIVVPAGGGGLIAGLAMAAKHIKPSIQIIGVQAQNAAAIVRSFESGKHVVLDSIATIADGIAIKHPGEIPLELIHKYVDSMVTVTDDELAAAILLLLERSKLAVEPSGASSLAAVLEGKIDCEGKTVVCVLTGGNIDVSFMHKIIERGLVKRDRIMEFSVVLSNRADAMNRFTKHLIDASANILSMHYERTSKYLGLNETKLNVTLEVGGKEHGEKIIKVLKKQGFIIAHKKGGAKYRADKPGLKGNF